MSNGSKTQQAYELGLNQESKIAVLLTGLKELRGASCKTLNVSVG
jgi:hypothetical protein